MNTTKNKPLPTSSNSQKDAEKLALDILKLSRNTLLIHLRFLEPALCRLSFQADPETTLQTDGTALYYSFIHVLKAYKIEPALMIHDYLHTVFHCIFHHPFIGDCTDSFCWDLACDIAVEASIEELALSSAQCARSERLHNTLDALRKEIPALHAERLYRYFQDQKLSPEELATLREPFMADEHTLWYQHSRADDPEKSSSDDMAEQASSDSGTSDGNRSDSDSGEEQASPSTDGNDEQTSGKDKNPFPDHAELLKEWKEISSRVQTDLETASRSWSSRTGNLIRGLKECNRERYDYTEFLKRFAVWGEILRPSEEEFDYIYYTYGLKLYENMPLVEPLEYTETKRIREFAIAIDTSASVDGELIQTFLSKTYNILKQSENYFERINLHIIQCDTNIQKDQKITCREELDEYLASLSLNGFGGTDFRPVFQYVDKLIEKGEFTDLKGLIYFTDGAGTYPASQPQYDTAFVFIEDEYEDRNVPVWAIKLILKEQDLL